MYIQTEFGLKKASETTETIVLDYYGEGLHETLSKAQEDACDPDTEVDLSTFKTQEARVYRS
jgi:hypothetical protein